MLLDAAGVDASTGSACSAAVNRASHVLTAMGVDVPTARGALRLTTGPATTDKDIDRLCAPAGCGGSGPCSRYGVLRRRIRRTVIGIIVTDPSYYPPEDPDHDTPPLLAALRERGADAQAVSWARHGRRLGVL